MGKGCLLIHAGGHHVRRRRGSGDDVREQDSARRAAAAAAGVLAHGSRWPAVCRSLTTPPACCLTLRTQAQHKHPDSPPPPPPGRLGAASSLLCDPPDLHSHPRVRQPPVWRPALVPLPPPRLEPPSRRACTMADYPVSSPRSECGPGACSAIRACCSSPAARSPPLTRSLALLSSRPALPCRPPRHHRVRGPADVWCADGPGLDVQGLQMPLA